ncbi:molecular chaperone [Coemansia spiralis]|uniref:Molecular chaperone n=1 Tax=Coemansia spiralis TaxID=417178 RepID=A0A9W8GER8_9FUNG|nr:molecular chaperone [Coemansia spiralis]
MAAVVHMQACQRHNHYYYHHSAAARAQPERKICWSCHRSSAPTALLCDNERCRAIQPVGKGVTYFDLLLDDGKPSFDVSAADLRRRFLKLQQTVHPDSFSQKEDVERKLAEAQSSWINHAYATLKDPLSRARYLLKLQGREIDEKDQIADPELLMEIMESREEIEMAKTESQVADIRLRNEQKVAGVVERLSQAFASGDLARARDLTHHLQYLRRISQTVHGWEPSDA